MKKMLLIAVTACLTIFTSCSKDGNENEMAKKFGNELSKLYPNATNIEWNSKSGYGVAAFTVNGKRTSAWFSEAASGETKWQMSEEEIPYSELPQAVKTSFEASEYGTWVVDDVEKIERYKMATVYVIDVEKGENEMEIHYSADGTLIKVVADDDDDNENLLPLLSELPEAIKTYISSNYPDGQIIDIDLEDNGYEIEIVDNNQHIEIIFDLTGKWISLEIDNINTSDVPTEVMTALNESKYSSYEIDDISFIKTETQEYYLFELENEDEEVEVKITLEGVILS